jgi:hypothetical protein
MCGQVGLLLTAPLPVIQRHEHGGGDRAKADDIEHAFHHG